MIQRGRRLHRHTYADYCAVELMSPSTKHEFLDGEIYAMTGSSVMHAGLTAVVSSMLVQQLRYGPCRVFSSDLRIRVLATGLATYPDVSVVCGAPEMDPESKHAITNPRVVVEVLSRSTERYDRCMKLQHYRQIPSLGAIVIVSQREHCIEVWSRGADDAWTSRASGPGEVAEIPVIECHLRVDDVYR